MTKRPRKVLIVGGGIGGPVLGMWLRRLPVEVVVCEARDGATLGEGAFLGVAPNGMHVLHELGVAEEVAARGDSCEAFRFSNQRGDPIGDIDRRHDRQRFGWPLVMIRRSELHLALAQEATRRGVEIRHGKRLVALDRADTQVGATFADGSTEEADLVIGCDGMRSTVRRLVVPDAPPPRPLGLLDCGGFAPRGEVPVAAGVNEMVFGHRAFFGAFVTDTETWWFHNGPFADDRAAPEGLRARLLELHADDPPWIAETIRATDEILGPWPLRELSDLPRWHDGRVCLMGDAAHAMSPSAGQGASMALEDAQALAQCLRDVDDPVEAFAVFERRRRPRVEAITRVARRNGSGKAPNNRFARWLRDRMMRFFLRRGAAAQERGFAHRVAWEEAAR